MFKVSGIIQWGEFSACFVFHLLTVGFLNVCFIKKILFTIYSYTSSFQETIQKRKPRSPVDITAEL